MDPTSQNHNTLIRDPNAFNFQKTFPENNTLMRERERGAKKKKLSLNLTKFRAQDEIHSQYFILFYSEGAI
jgi:hypothetical protein